MSSPIRISAIVPTHRRPATLARALASIAAQQRPVDEVIVVNDGPAEDLDAIHTILKAGRFEAAAAMQNGRAPGVSGARNWGADAASGDWLTFLDDDDEWLPGYIEQVSREIAGDELDAVCTQIAFEWVSGSGSAGRPACPSLEAAEFLTRNPGMTGTNLAIRKETYLSVRGFDETLPFAEDMDFGLRLSLRGGVRYRAIQQPLVRLYQHGGERLCTPRSEKVQIGVKRFFELHRDRMTDAQQARYSQTMRQLWGIDENGRLV